MRLPARRPRGFAAGPWVVLLALSVAVAACGAAAANDERTVLGWIEWVKFHPLEMKLKAKMDTGATTSSLHAEDIERFERDGAKWVRFDVVDPESEERVTMEKPVARNVRIRQHGEEYDRRPVVVMGMCVGDVFAEKEFTLTDRSGFLYKVLVGRNYMKDVIVVDSGTTFTQKPSCNPDLDQSDASGPAEEDTP